jgi:hypothetical protein
LNKDGNIPQNGEIKGYAPTKKGNIYPNLVDTMNMREKTSLR